MHFYKFYIFLLSILLISYCGGDTDTTITTTTSSTSTAVVETTSTNEKLVVWDEIITSDFQKIINKYLSNRKFYGWNELICISTSNKS